VLPNNYGLKLKQISHKKLFKEQILILNGIEMLYLNLTQAHIFLHWLI